MNKYIEPYNDKGQQHGYWEWYWTNGDVWYKSFFINGQESGYEEFHYSNHNTIELIFHL